MLPDTVKYWLAVAAIMLLMWGYSGQISAAVIFGAAAVGAFVYWQVMAQRKQRALDTARDGRKSAHERPRGA